MLIILTKSFKYPYSFLRPLFNQTKLLENAFICTYKNQIIFAFLRFLCFEDLTHCDTRQIFPSHYCLTEQLLVTQFTIAYVQSEFIQPECSGQCLRALPPETVECTTRPHSSEFRQPQDHRDMRTDRLCWQQVHTDINFSRMFCGCKTQQNNRELIQN